MEEKTKKLFLVDDCRSCPFFVKGVLFNGGLCGLNGAIKFYPIRGSKPPENCKLRERGVIVALKEGV